jgi:hypothetical protein
MVTNEQLYVVVGVPKLFNAILTALGIAFLKIRFDASDKHLDDMSNRWRAQVRRAEEVNEARRKQIKGGPSDPR